MCNFFIANRFILTLLRWLNISSDFPAVNESLQETFHSKSNVQYCIEKLDSAIQLIFISRPRLKSLKTQFVTGVSCIYLTRIIADSGSTVLGYNSKNSGGLTVLLNRHKSYFIDTYR